MKTIYTDYIKSLKYLISLFKKNNIPYYGEDENFNEFAKKIWNKIPDYEKKTLYSKVKDKHKLFAKQILEKYVTIKKEYEKYDEFVENLYNGLYFHIKWWLLKETIEEMTILDYFDDKAIIEFDNIWEKNGKKFIIYPKISLKDKIQYKKNELFKIDDIWNLLKEYTETRDQISSHEININGDYTYNFSYLVFLINTIRKNNVLKSTFKLAVIPSTYEDAIFNDLVIHFKEKIEYEKENIYSKIKNLEKKMYFLYLQIEEFKKLKISFLHLLKSNRINNEEYFKLIISTDNQIFSNFKKISKIYEELNNLTDLYLKS